MRRRAQTCVFTSGSFQYLLASMRLRRPADGDGVATSTANVGVEAAVGADGELSDLVQEVVRAPRGVGPRRSRTISTFPRRRPARVIAPGSTSPFPVRSMVESRSINGASPGPPNRAHPIQLANMTPPMRRNPQGGGRLRQMALNHVAVVNAVAAGHA